MQKNTDGTTPKENEEDLVQYPPEDKGPCFFDGDWIPDPDDENSKIE